MRAACRDRDPESLLRLWCGECRIAPLVQAEEERVGLGSFSGLPSTLSRDANEHGAVGRSPRTSGAVITFVTRGGIPPRWVASLLLVERGHGGHAHRHGTQAPTRGDRLAACAALRRPRAAAVAGRTGSRAKPRGHGIPGAGKGLTLTANTC